MAIFSFTMPAEFDANNSALALSLFSQSLRVGTAEFFLFGQFVNYFP
jgi:hypothetical protein